MPRAMQLFEIPEKFNKNAPEVRARGSQAQTGAMLIQYMCERMGFENLGGSSVLDLGCGCRFTDAILNLGLPIKSYTGIDIDGELMRFFQENLQDERFFFSHWDVSNPLYNPEGAPLETNARLPIPDTVFDVVCMFSVITHQIPDDAAAIFTILRKYIKHDGFLFFSAGIYAPEGEYMELVPSQVAGFSGYSLKLMESIVKSAGWTIISFEEKEPNGIPIQASFLCSPA